MTDTIRDQAAAALSEVEKVTAVLLPEPGTEIVPLETAPADKAAEIGKRMAELDMSNTQSIISFGSAAQAELQVWPGMIHVFQQFPALLVEARDALADGGRFIAARFEAASTRETTP